MQTRHSVSRHPSLRSLEWGRRTYVMGILNLTPDSFSGDGLGEGVGLVERAVARAQALVAEGADVLDIGGESTRPGAPVLSAGEEQRRVLPVLRALRQVVDVPLSIDTYRASTAELALHNGADWVNDIWGLQFDPDMVKVVAEAGCPVIIMHNGRKRLQPQADDQSGGYYGYFHYDDVVREVREELAAAVKMALSQGVAPANIILDPGIGFGKTSSQNLTLVSGLAEIKALGYPVLLGTSRKGFIGHVLGGLSAENRLEGTAATLAIGIERGADMVRVHDVQAMARVARMTDALVRPRADR